MIFKNTTSQHGLKNLSTQDFLSFGMQDVAYVKQTTSDGISQFSIHAADGTQLSVMDSMHEAMNVIRYNDLEVVVLN